MAGLYAKLGFRVWGLHFGFSVEGFGICGLAGTVQSAHTVRSLYMSCHAQPSHPNSQTFRDAVYGMPELLKKPSTHGESGVLP